MSGSLEIIIRTYTAFLLLWCFVQIAGKQTIAQKTYHLYIASITMGTIGGNLAFNIKVKFFYFILSLLLMGSTVIALNFLALKSRKIRKWITGEPTALIHQGQVLDHNMKKIGYTMDSLYAALREKDIFDMRHVENASLEVNGTVTILKKPEYRNITNRDLKKAFSANHNHLPLELIMEGRVLEQNLCNDYGQDWLLKELEKRKVDFNEVYYAVVGTNGSLYIDINKGFPDA